MPNAPFLLRFATCIAACVLLTLLAPKAPAQTIDVSLNVYYDNPANVNSGGMWELVAKSSDFGISTLQVRLTNILSGAQPEGPRGNVNGTDPAGFSLFDHFVDNSIFTGQELLFLGPGEEQGAMYGVGRPMAHNPGDIGWTLNTLSNPQDIPWANGDPLVDGPSPWDVAARLASGEFAVNVTPGFVMPNSEHFGTVFTTLGSPTMFGESTLATINRFVRTNFETAESLPDYNNNGVVDAADYVLWRKGDPAADGNNDTFVNQLDYDLWREHFGEVVEGSGGTAGNSGSAVPEPASGILLVFGLFFASLARRPRAVSRVS